MDILKISIWIIIITVAISHLLIFLKLTSRIFWIVIDYFWISLSIVAIVSISGDLNKIENSWRLSEANYRIASNYQEAINNTKMYQKYYDPKTSNFQYSIFKDTCMRNSYISASIWYSNLLDTLNKYEDKIVGNKEFLINKVIGFTDSFPYRNSKYKEMENIFNDLVLNNIEQVREDCFLRSDLILAQDGPGWVLDLKFFSAFLLSLAIGLRLSKVTAQLKKII